MGISELQFFTLLLESNMARLAEVARRASHGMSSADRDEVLAASLLRAWERREDFQPDRNAGTPEGNIAGFFDGIARNEARKLRRREIPRGNPKALENLVGADDPASITAADQLVDKAARGLNARNAMALRSVASGASNREAARDADVSRHKASKLRGKLKEAAVDGVVDFHISGAERSGSKHADDDNRALSAIDEQLARADNLTYPPRHGQECAPCLLCAWYAGLSRGNPRQVADPELQAAIDNTHARKVAIAAMVASDNWQTPVTHCVPEATSVNIQHKVSL